ARARVMANVVGASMIAGSVFLITSRAAFPGWIAVFPVAGAALVLTAVVASPNGQSIGPFGHPTIQWLGDNSYSIYLWHWPLIIVAPWAIRAQERWPQKLVVLALSLVLAALTKRLVEDPIRRGRIWRLRRWPAYSLGVVGVAT